MNLRVGRHEIPLVQAGARFVSPPRWATLMRQLIDDLPKTVTRVLEKYTHPDGSLLWPTKPSHQGIDGLDDAYESFHNWPLFHLVGGSSVVLDAAQREFEAITEQFKRYDTGHGFPMVVADYEQGYDWFHQGEGYLLFYHLCAAHPQNPRLRELAARFAGFLINEGTPEPNYNAVHRILRCGHIGSMGPGFRNFGPNSWNYQGGMVYYGLPFQEFPECADPESFFRLPENARKMGEVFARRQGTGDVAINLASTSMAVNAFMMTGDDRFRTWALEYIDSWIDRATANGGLIPDNVGLSGKVGETTDGKWYGGHYGWTWPHGWRSIGDAVTIATENALLLTGDQRYTDFLRTQLRQLAERGVNQQGTLHVPHKFGDAGWYGYRTYIPNILKDERGHVLWKKGAFEFYPMRPYYSVKLVEMGHRAEDKDLAKKLRNHFRQDWKSVAEASRKDLSGNEAAWLEFIQGRFPRYPEKILEHNLGQMQDRLHKIEFDTQDPSTFGDSYLQERNPFSLEGLVQLTMGCSLPVYNGGLLQSRIRHFDVERKQPGLPQSTAALVERIDGSCVTVTLVNLSETENKTMLLQAGSFGEHRFSSLGRAIGEKQRIHAQLIAVELSPRSGVTMELGLRCHCAMPSMSLPWD